MTDPVVSADVAPTKDADRWERGSDPWHADAFPDEFKERAPHQGKRAEGWYDIDWCGNVIGFVPDGTPLSAPRDLLTVLAIQED